MKKLFYTSNEYNITPVIENGGNILELGRSCVAKKYRTGATMQLLMVFYSTVYYTKYEIDIMFGCASFPGVNPNIHKNSFDYLYRNYLAPKEIRPTALKERFIKMKSEAHKKMSFKDFFSIYPTLDKGIYKIRCSCR